MRRVLLICIVASAALGASGCFLAPAISSVREAGLTNGDRQRLLSRDVQQFTDALYWGDATTAMQFVMPEIQPKIRDQMRVSKREERIVESRVENVIFSQDAYEADVDMTVRYFRIPFYVVTDRMERQAWQFTVPSGWRLKERQLEEAPKS